MPEYINYLNIKEGFESYASVCPLYLGKHKPHNITRYEFRSILKLDLHDTFFSPPVFNNSFHYTVIRRIKRYSHFEILNESFIKEMLLIEIQIDFNNRCH